MVQQLDPDTLPDRGHGFFIEAEARDRIAVRFASERHDGSGNWFLRPHELGVLR